MGGEGGPGVHGDTVLLGLIALGAFGYFRSFDAELKRSELDCASDPDSVSACEVVFDTVPEEKLDTLAELIESERKAKAPPPP